MQSNNQKQYPEGCEIEYAKYLYKEGLLPDPGKCSYGSKSFYIQIDNANQTSKCCFRFQNIKCRLKYAIRINSVFSLFPQIKLKILSQLIFFFFVENIMQTRILKQ